MPSPRGGDGLAVFSEQEDGGAVFRGSGSTEEQQKGRRGHREEGGATGRNWDFIGSTESTSESSALTFPRHPPRSKAPKMCALFQIEGEHPAVSLLDGE